jgi:hypothetical protein
MTPIPSHVATSIEIVGVDGHGGRIPVDSGRAQVTTSTRSQSAQDAAEAFLLQKAGEMVTLRHTWEVAAFERGAVFGNLTEYLLSTAHVLAEVGVLPDAGAVEEVLGLLDHTLRGEQAPEYLPASLRWMLEHIRSDDGRLVCCPVENPRNVGELGISVSTGAFSPM